jgi:putative component of membrane protein insertase Oxa1/YidC/SpoIIIJ protein YidD
MASGYRGENRPISFALIIIIRVYRYASCSTYAMDAIRIHGCLRGMWLTVRRILRCHPWHPGGIDRVPE